MEVKQKCSQTGLKAKSLVTTLPTISFNARNNGIIPQTGSAEPGL